MAKSNITKLPVNPRAIGQDNAFWLIAVLSGLEDKYSCEYDTERNEWCLKIQSSTFQGAEALTAKCRHILGWDTPASAAEVAQ